VPANILDASRHLTRRLKVHFVFRNTTVDLDILHSPADNVTLANINHALTCLKMTLEFLYSKIGGAVKHVRMLWVRCDVPKIVKRTTSILGPEHVNSGYTILGGNQGNHIVIFRIEEAEKVMVHELIHLWKYDRSLFDRDTEAELESKLPYIIKSTQGIRINEAITETIATLLYTSFCVKQPLQIKQAMILQRDHAIKQAAKILEMQGFSHLSKLKTRAFEEESHVFSYYVIKAALLYYWRCFQNIINLNLGPSDTSALLRKALINPRFIQALHAEIKKLSNSTKARFSSMRMTAVLNIYEKKN
jgi:hypothetical protein